MTISLRSGKQLGEPKVVEKTTKDNGKGVEDSNAKKEVVNKELLSNQSEKVKPY